MSVLAQGWAALATRIDRRRRWHRFPKWVGIAILVGLRDRLRQRNLVDVGLRDPAHALDPRWLTARSDDGSYNSLDQPGMGAVGQAFGRNVPLADSWPEREPRLLTPSPRILSRALLTRDELLPVRTANVLVAAWLQFEVHDWINHGLNAKERPWSVATEADDPWFERPMRIERTRPDPDTAPGRPPTFSARDTHWWDGSQIYGTTAAEVADRRGEDGTLRMDPDGLTPADIEARADLAGVAGNQWLGLQLLHTLFTAEHNAIVKMLQAAYPHLGDDQLFDKARLINAALMAKIHTVEWTPAVIAHPTTAEAMKINWWGLVGERTTRRFGRFTPDEVISGIPGSPTDQHGVPFSITEEFVAVYRMHQLLPDEFTFRSLAERSRRERLGFGDIGALQTRSRLRSLGVADCFYSLGLEHPGQVCLHNYPRSLQELVRPTGELVDLAAIDLLRVRERGVPRYNAFRRLVHLPPVRSFDELTPNPIWAREIADAYGGDIDEVDLLIGTYAEEMPAGFVFSDTAFRIFILMASRRLESDRFFTDDYRPGIYTAEGLAWIDDNTMSSVLLRHYPELAPALAGVTNAFAPWNEVA